MNPARARPITAQVMALVWNDPPVFRSAVRPGGAMARWMLLALLALLACALAPGAAADSRVQIDLGVAQEVERFQSLASDSLGLTHTLGTVGLVAMEFTVLEMAVGAHRPSLQVGTRISTHDRVFIAAPFGAGGPEVPARARMFDLRGSIGFGIPMGLVDGTRGARLTLGYEGGVIVTRDTGDNFLQVSMVRVGFERVGGVLDGSGVWVGLGHDDRFGPSWASGRWSARTLIQSALFGARPEAPPATAKGAPPVATHAPLRVFAELYLETDGRAGPDALGARIGALFDPWEAVARVAGGGSKPAAGGK